MKWFVSLGILLAVFSHSALAEDNALSEQNVETTRISSEELNAEPEEKGDIKIQVKNSDIRSFIDWIASETEKNLIIDPRVKGKVTVVVNEPLNREEAWSVFKEVLALHGFAVLEGGRAVKVMPGNLVKQAGVPYREGVASENADNVIRVIKTRYISAAQIIPAVKPLVPQTGHLAALQDSNLLLVVAEDRIISQLSKVINQLDQQFESDLYVARLKYANAKDVIAAISTLSGKSKAGQLPSQQILMAADERTNSVLLAGSKQKIERWKTIISQLDREEIIEDEAHVIYLDFMKASEAADVLKDITASILKRDKNLAGDDLQIAIRASESTNSLVISAPPSYLSTIKKMIDKLDIRRAQVLVEAIIVEIGDQPLTEFGVQWSTSGRARNGEGWYGGAKLTTGSSIGVDGYGKGDEASLGTGLSLGFYRNGSLRALVQALSSDSKVNILSTPSLIALDNEEGKIVVGENVPFITGSTTNSSSTTDQPFQTIERRDIGLKLNVTPQINQGQLMTLDIYQEISSVSDSSAASDIITRTRSIETQIQVESGSVIVLGGLISDEISSTEQKVPLLGDIPVLGHLFRSNSQQRTRKNLMVFIKPTILRSSSDALNVTGGKYSYIREQQLAYNAGDGHLIELDSPLPVLSSFNFYSANQPGDSAETQEKE